MLIANTYKRVTTIGRREAKLDESVPQDKLVCRFKALQISNDFD
jgi:hypothetical protein